MLTIGSLFKELLYFMNPWTNVSNKDIRNNDVNLPCLASPLSVSKTKSGFLRFFVAILVLCYCQWKLIKVVTIVTLMIQFSLAWRLGIIAVEGLQLCKLKAESCFSQALCPKSSCPLDLTVVMPTWFDNLCICSYT